MAKQRLYLEYPLSARQSDIVWKLIGTDHGLGRWIADEVTEENGVISFTWGQPWTDHHTLKANVIEREKNSHIRFRWVSEEDEDYFWELRIGKSDLTEEICLCVSDYAQEEEIDDLRILWDGNMERLHESSGL